LCFAAKATAFFTYVEGIVTWPHVLTLAAPPKEWPPTTLITVGVPAVPGEPPPLAAGLHVPPTTNSTAGARIALTPLAAGVVACSATSSACASGSFCTISLVASAAMTL